MTRKVDKMPVNLLKAYKIGNMTRLDLAADLKVSVGTIENLLRRSGYVPCKSTGPQKHTVVLPDELMQRLHDGEMTLHEAAAEAGTTYKGLTNAIRENHATQEDYEAEIERIKLAWREKTFAPHRAELLTYAQNNAVTLQEIGDKFGISRERVRQVLKKHGVDRMKFINCVSCGRMMRCRIGPAVCPDCL